MTSLDARLMEGFTEAFLKPRYDNPATTPEFHRHLWRKCTDETLRKYAAAAPREHAKAQPLTCGVLTPTGWVTIGDLKVGDLVVGADGEPNAVTAVHPIAEMDVYEVVTRDGRRTRCNAEHLWTVQIPSNTKDRTMVQPLHVIQQVYHSLRYDRRVNKHYDEYRCFLPLPAPIKLCAQILPLDPYVFGVWLGDGHSTDGRITSADPEIFNWFAPFVVEKQAGQYLYGVRGLRAVLKSLNVVGNKHVPANYLIGSIEQRLALLQGLMDTDGTVHQDGRLAYFGNNNRNLLDSVIQLVRSLGGIAHETYRPARCGEKYFDSWVVSVKLPNGLCPFRIKRKVGLWRGDCKNQRIAIISIRYIGREPSRCITVESSDGLYITDDFLVTHNSTAVTHALGLAVPLFGFRDYLLIVSDTEGQSVKFLGDIKMELQENELLQREFGIDDFIRDTEAEIVFHCAAGYVNITARGAEQKVRGLKWRGRRPNFILVDDLENDELVMNRDRRSKLKNWFHSALLPCGAWNCLYRVVGTILHLDSVLNNILTDPTWDHDVFSAHGPNFDNILWPERFPVGRLEQIKRGFMAQGLPDKYSQEYLNKPIDEETAYFKREWFTWRAPEHRKLFLRRFAAIDLAVSTKETADYTAIVVAGIDDRGRIHILEVRRSRWDSLETVQQMFEVQEQYRPDLFFVEKGPLNRAFYPFLVSEMARTGVYINLLDVPCTADKVSRARSLQAKMRQGTVLFEQEAGWLPDLMSEMTRFPRDKHDDQVDAMALIGQGLDELGDAPSPRELEDEEYNVMFRDSLPEGRSETCGY